MKNLSVNHLKKNIRGTLIAVIIYKNNFYLFSDGRVVGATNKNIVSESFSKLHKLTNYTAMLTAGRYLPNLVPEIVKKCDQKGVVFINAIIEIAKTEMEKQWKEHLNEVEGKEFKDNRLFCFIVGYNKKEKPHLYYLDNQTSIPFLPQKRELNQDIEIAALSTGSSNYGSENPGNELSYFIKLEYERGNFEDNTGTKIYNAFGNTQLKLSLINQSIGGNIFMSIIDFENGYQLKR
ncbi:hypothetical protein ES705_12335 [subsurface metagenome]